MTLEWTKTAHNNWDNTAKLHYNCFLLTESIITLSSIILRWTNVAYCPWNILLPRLSLDTLLYKDVFLASNFILEHPLTISVRVQSALLLVKTDKNCKSKYH